MCVHSFPSCREVLFHQEAKNESEDYIPAPWVPTFEVQTTASHTFTLREENVEEAVVRGCEFMVNPIEPIHFEVEGCPTLYTGGVTDAMYFLMSARSNIHTTFPLHD